MIIIVGLNSLRENFVHVIQQNLVSAYYVPGIVRGLVGVGREGGLV